MLCTPKRHVGFKISKSRSFKLTSLILVPDRLGAVFIKSIGADLVFAEMESRSSSGQILLQGMEHTSIIHFNLSGWLPKTAAFSTRGEGVCHENKLVEPEFGCTCLSEEAYIFLEGSVAANIIFRLSSLVAYI